jgi:hypothetical protein
MPSTRRLPAILAADVAGDSRLTEQDEAGTARALRETRHQFENRQSSQPNNPTIATGACR